MWHHWRVRYHGLSAWQVQRIERPPALPNRPMMSPSGPDYNMPQARKLPPSMMRRAPQPCNIHNHPVAHNDSVLTAQWWQGLSMCYGYLARVCRTVCLSVLCPAVPTFSRRRPSSIRRVYLQRLLCRPLMSTPSIIRCLPEHLSHTSPLFKRFTCLPLVSILSMQHCAANP